MFDTPVMLTPLHYAYLIGVIAILAVMVRRRDTPAVCIAFLFILGVIGLGSVAGGIMTVFNAVLYAAREFMEVIATIALVTALSKCLKDLGSDYLMMVPMSRVMKTPSLTWWILGLTMFLFSLFLWPSPSVALVGAIMLPFAVKAGLNPLAAAMAMNLFGHGFALSYDFVIQGAPGVSAGAAGVSSADILTQAAPVFWVMGIATVVSAFLLNRRTMGIQSVVPAGPRLFGGGEGADSGELPSGGDGGVFRDRWSLPPTRSLPQSGHDPGNSHAAGFFGRHSDDVRVQFKRRGCHQPGFRNRCPCDVRRSGAGF